MKKSDLIFRTENIQRYFRDIKHPKYNPIEDAVLRKMFCNREMYREQIINAHIRLVAMIAKTYDNSDKFMDFNQEGIEGLLEAFEKYDPNQKSQFQSYAAYWIRAKMSMLCREFNMVQRSNVGKVGSKAQKFQDRYFAENLCDATPEQVLEHLSTNCGIDIQNTDDVLSISITSINEPTKAKDGNREGTLETCGDFAISTSSRNGYIDEIESEDLKDAIRQMMKVLSEREKDFVIRHIYNEESYDTIAEEEGYSIERVRQIVVGALKKMKNSECAKTRFSYFAK
jgi:RNA polymerase sigma factor (sigma-70 family)